ncbi:MAG TPA: NYN domain-containing protein [Anaerolineales bacterium]|nr:NYN domain-containing protein [Anaerolineales bacterium]
MPFLIDGHNLVPKAGFRLADVDVENDLIEKLQVFCRIRRTSVEVYFDGGLPGQPSRGKFGNVTAFFVRRGKTADEAIEKRLQALGKTARNWAVVSSDRRVRSAALEAHARSISSEEFSSFLSEATDQEFGDIETEPRVDPDDVSLWLKEFGEE